MLEARGLTKLYGSFKALDSLDLSIEPGQVFCLLGANGAGKTTTINLFLNFIEASSGEARVHGLQVAENPLETKKHLAYIPEQVMLYRHLTGLENLEYFTALARHEEYSQDQLRRFLNEAGIPADAIDRRVSTYSKGMRQKVGIAIAVAKLKFRGKIRDKSLFDLRLAGFGIAVHWERSDQFKRPLLEGARLGQPL